MDRSCAGGRRAGAVAVALALALGAGTAVGAAPRPDRPWAAGVSADAQREAEVLFRDGVELLKDAFFTRAVDRLRASAALWDHPATHFNLAKALLNLDQPDAAVEHLWRAMRYGGAPLQPSQIDQVERYHDLVLGLEVSHLVVRSDVRGVTVGLGGMTLLDGPGVWEGLVRTDGASALVAVAGEVEVGRLERGFKPGTRTEVVFSGVTPGVAPKVTERVATDADTRTLQRAVVGFEVGWPTAEQRAAWKAEDERRAREAQTAATTPRRDASRSVCDGATGELATVCRTCEDALREVEELRRRAEAARREAVRRLEALTRGGLVESLD